MLALFFDRSTGLMVPLGKDTDRAHSEGVEIRTKYEFEGGSVQFSSSVAAESFDVYKATAEGVCSFSIEKGFVCRRCGTSLSFYRDEAARIPLVCISFDSGEQLESFLSKADTQPQYV